MLNLIVPLMTIATIFGIFLGNNFVWLGVILFGFNTIIDTLTKDIHLRADFDEDGNSFGIKKFQYAVMYLMLPTFIVLQIILAWRLFHNLIEVIFIWYYLSEWNIWY